MIFTYSQLDLEAYNAASKDPPHDIIQRKQNELWLVPHEPIDLTKPVDWKWHRHKEYVYVPLHPYLLPAEPALALGYMLQLALRAMVDLKNRDISRLHLAIGRPVHEITLDTGTSWQYQVGIAVCTK